MKKSMIIFFIACVLLLIGMYVDIPFLQTLFCLSAGVIFGLGWIADMRDRANETLQGKDGD